MCIKLRVALLLIIDTVNAAELDGNGYLAYCPCMGRFGNQADHFLGALAFSKAINRTLILPPWVEYRYGETRSVQVPFDAYFKVHSLSVYHKVISMEEFMKEVAARIWPEDKRISFCFTKRVGKEEESCNAKSGNPFGPFWDTFSIDFVGSEFYGPLNYDAHNSAMMKKWIQKYPASAWPVLAFTDGMKRTLLTKAHPYYQDDRNKEGAPASFPLQDGNQILQKYLKWSVDIERKSKDFIKKNMGEGGFLGIHLRNGNDWVKACQHVQDSPLLFAAPQCIGYRNERGILTHSMCLPSKPDIIKQVMRALKKVDGLKYLFVASDSDHMIEDLAIALKHQKIKVLVVQPTNPYLDLAILGQANYFIGNCVSSYSAFVKRERDVNGLPSEFWSYPAHRKSKHEEL